MSKNTNGHQLNSMSGYTVIANTEPKETTLRIKANVQKVG